MATLRKITRDEQARQLAPEGWEWHRGISPTRKLVRNPRSPRSFVKGWSSGILVLKTNSLADDVKAYRALVIMLNTYDVSYDVEMVRVQGSRPRIPQEVRVWPRGTGEQIPQYIGTNANILNIEGWNMWDGTFVAPGEFTIRGVPIACCKCHSAYPRLVTDPDTGQHYCRSCVNVCPGLGAEECNTPIFNTKFQGCDVHFPKSNCEGCSQSWDRELLQVFFTGKRYCPTCYSQCCPRCGTPGIIDPVNTPVLTDGKYERYQVCSDCSRDVKAWLGQDRGEKIVLEKVPNLQILSHPNRAIRAVSIEFEVARGIGPILQELYERKLTASPNLMRYHQGNGRSGFCYAEYDGSLSDTGGEIIVSKAKLNDPRTAENLQTLVGVIRRHVKKGTSEMDMTTGLHIHVDAHNMGFNHVRNLVLLFNYLEDPIYRLSATNYTRHRGIHYAMLLPKVGIDTQAEFNRRLFSTLSPNDQHHSVLNVQNFYSAVGGSCQCGHILAGNPQDCKCDLGKCTVEFRVFNGTCSWKKLHAYLALCLGMVAFARNNEDMVLSDFEPCYYFPLAPIGNELKTRWMDRLTWLYKNIYFSEDERASLTYCIEHSELSQLTYAQRRDLREIEYSGKKYIRSIPKKEEKIPNPYKLRKPANRLNLNIQPAGRAVSPWDNDVAYTLW